MKCLERDLEECLTVLKFPFANRVKIRTTNLLERLFGEGKRLTTAIPRFTSESSGLTLLFAVLVDASEGYNAGCGCRRTSCTDWSRWPSIPTASGRTPI